MKNAHVIPGTTDIGVTEITKGTQVYLVGASSVMDAIRQANEMNREFAKEAKEASGQTSDGEQKDEEV